MSAPVWSQADSGVALVLGVIVGTAAVRKLQRPAVFTGTLQRLDPALAERPGLATRLTFAVAGYEAVVAVGVIASRAGPGFFFGCALLVACFGFLIALVRAVRQSIPCACFGRLGRTAAGGREIGRGIALVVGAAFLVVHRALDASPGYGVGLVAVAVAVAAVCVIVVAQRIGMRIRPGIDLDPGASRAPRSFVSSMRTLTGYDNELYSSGS